ncbi:MAG: restriction endonuclease [bacterium]|nr:restriction endonuclease [bacterium]
MAVPGYQDFMLPLLKIAADGQEYKISDAMDALAAEMVISEEDQQLMLPSGTQTQYYNRVSWAVMYLAKSLLLERTGWGRFKIAPRGTDVLKTNVPRIDNSFLSQFPEYQAFKHKGANAPKPGDNPPLPPDPEITPEEQLQAAHEELRSALADDLLDRVRVGSPKFFEHLVIRLLVAMGYGGGRMDRAEVTGKSGDDGIDGLIREDRLGLDMVYVQAKKWDSSVGPGEIDRFIGSLTRKKATKGVFITSGAFTVGAPRAAKEASVRVRLIDGDELASLMIDFNVGVAEAEKYIVKKVDTDFFEPLA